MMAASGHRTHTLVGEYVTNRVFFADEATAIRAGYLRWAVCLPEEYARWRSAT